MAETVKKEIVAVAKADSYEEEVVASAVRRLFGLLGNPSRFFKAGRKVALKPNLLMAAEPDRAITTHPQVVSAVADVCLAEGTSVQINRFRPKLHSD